MSADLEWKVFHEHCEVPVRLLVTPEEKKEYTETRYGCKHPKTEIRIRTIAGGRTQRIQQCLTCGSAVGGAIKKDARANDAQFDLSLVDRVEAEAEARRGEIYERALQRTAELVVEGYASYEEYLDSEEWAVKRDAVLNRDGHKCQACLVEVATQVHHLTYDRIYEEPMFDLVSVCRACHEKVHAKKIAAAAAVKLGSTG